MVEDYVSRLFGSYLERREAGETFAHFCVRSSDNDLISIASGNVSTGADAAA
jgi:sulfite reductase beta subunit-like hemoprotein